VPHCHLRTGFWRCYFVGHKKMPTALWSIIYTTMFWLICFGLLYNQKFWGYIIFTAFTIIVKSSNFCAPSKTLIRLTNILVLFLVCDNNTHVVNTYTYKQYHTKEAGLLQCLTEIVATTICMMLINSDSSLYMQYSCMIETKIFELNNDGLWNMKS